LRRHYFGNRWGRLMNLHLRRLLSLFSWRKLVFGALRSFEDAWLGLEQGFHFPLWLGGLYFSGKGSFWCFARVSFRHWLFFLFEIGSGLSLIKAQLFFSGFWDFFYSHNIRLVILIIGIFSVLSIARPSRTFFLLSRRLHFLFES
jgi:hypothetical protein